MAVHGNWTGRVDALKIDDDARMGRWTGITLHGSNQNKLTVITTYQTTKTNKPGEQTAHSQQASMIEETRKPNERLRTPRQQYIKDLRELIYSLKQQKHEILIMGDFNDDARPEANTPISNLMAELNMTNLHQYKHPDLPTIRTHNRGSTQIDYMFGTENVAQAVIRAGFEPFGDHIPTDHRGIYVDLEMTKLLGNQPVNLNPPTKRILHARDPNQNPKYKHTIAQYFDNHNMDNREQEIRSELDALPPQSEIPTALQHKLERLDRDLERAMKTGEAATAKRYASPWSPELMLERKRKHWWCLWMTEIRTKSPRHEQRQALCDKYQFDPPITHTPTINEARKGHSTQIRILREQLRKATESRKNFLEQKAIAMETLGYGDKKQNLKAIRNSEESAHVYQKMRRVTGKTKGGPIGYTQVPNIPDRPGHPPHYPLDKLNDAEKARVTFDTVNDPDIMGDLMINRNTDHFGQAEGSEFTLQPLQDMLVPDACTKIADAMLKQNTHIDNNEISPVAKAMLTAIQHPLLPTLDINTAVQTIIGKYKAWRTSTTTSPSGLYLDLYKAIFTYEPKEPPPPTDENNEPWIVDRFFRIISTKLRAAADHSMIYDRWLTVVTCMLEKNPRKQTH